MSKTTQIEFLIDRPSFFVKKCLSWDEHVVEKFWKCIKLQLTSQRNELSHLEIFKKKSFFSRSCPVIFQILTNEIDDMDDFINWFIKIFISKPEDHL